MAAGTAGTAGTAGAKDAPDYAELQRNELTVLESIFGDSFKVVLPPASRDPLAKAQRERPNAPAHFTIRIVPHPGDLKDERNFAWVLLDVTFSPQYPKKAPIVRLEKGEGLSTDDFKALRSRVNREVNRLVGDEQGLVYPVTELIKDYLLERNQKPVSFYEEMLEREHREKEERKQQLLKERELAAATHDRERHELVKQIEAEKQRKDAAARKRSAKPPGAQTPTTGAASAAPGAPDLDADPIDLAAASRNAIAALTIAMPTAPAPAAAAAAAGGARTPKGAATPSSPSLPPATAAAATPAKGTHTAAAAAAAAGTAAAAAASGKKGPAPPAQDDSGSEEETGSDDDSDAKPTAAAAAAAASKLQPKRTPAPAPAPAAAAKPVAAAAKPAAAKNSLATDDSGDEDEDESGDDDDDDSDGAAKKKPAAAPAAAAKKPAAPAAASTAAAAKAKPKPPASDDDDSGEGEESGSGEGEDEDDDDDALDTGSRPTTAPASPAKPTRPAVPAPAVAGSSSASAKATPKAAPAPAPKAAAQPAAAVPPSTAKRKPLSGDAKTLAPAAGPAAAAAANGKAGGSGSGGGAKGGAKTPQTKSAAASDDDSERSHPGTSKSPASMDVSEDGDFVSFDFKSAVEMIDRDTKQKKEDKAKARVAAKLRAEADLRAQHKEADLKRDREKDAKAKADAAAAKPKPKAAASDDDDDDGDEDEEEDDDDGPNTATAANRFNALSPQAKKTAAAAAAPTPKSAAAAAAAAKAAPPAVAKKPSAASPHHLAVPAPVSRKASGNAAPAAAASAAAAAAPVAVVQASRFETDFEQLGLLGRGGFGEVLKVRNKLDGLFYAIKRIKLRRGHMAKNRKIIREVSTIARLHHRYIVRYFQAWIEGAATSSDSKSGAKKRGSRSGRSRSGHRSGGEGDDDDGDDWLNPSVSTYGGGHGDGDGDDDDDDDGDEDEEDDDEDDDSGEGEDDEDEASATPVSGAHQYLYIQMEYCANKTLRDLIDERTMNADTVWRLFRQTLEAIAEIHRKGIMHRDIKPPNIFIDSQGNIKLGDFGLAVAASKGPAQAAAAAADAKDRKDAPAKGKIVKRSAKDDHEHEHDSVTEGVGTPFYRAPEQETGVDYDQKADIFSLGVIFYEMWRPFSTLMERANHLMKLRERGRVPDDFVLGGPPGMPGGNPQLALAPTTLATHGGGQSDPAAPVRRLIEWVLQKQPSQRPSANELLKSGLIPLKLEDEYMDLALKAVTDRDNPFHARLMDQLFLSGTADAVADFTFDYAAGGGGGGGGLQPGAARPATHPSLAHHKQTVPPHLRNAVQGHTFERVTHIFRMHGAVLFETPLIAPKTDRVLAKTYPAAYLDPSGVIVQLPYTLTVPFARAVAQRRVVNDMSEPTATGAAAVNVSSSDPRAMGALKLDFRRFDISKVYRRNPNGGGRPKELYECVFDVVWSNKHARARSSSNLLAAMGLGANAASKKTKDSRAKAREKAALIEAETIKICEEILREFSIALGGQYSIRVNHLDVFDALLDAVLNKPHSYLLFAPTASAATSRPAFGAAAAAAAGAGDMTMSGGDITLSLAPSSAGAAGLGVTAAGTPKDATKSLTAASAASLVAALNAATSAGVAGDSKALAAAGPAVDANWRTRVNVADVRREVCTLASQRVINVPWNKSHMRRALLKEKVLTPKAIDTLGTLLGTSPEPGKVDTVITKITRALGILNGGAGGGAGGVLTGSDESDLRLLDAFDSMKQLFAALDTFGIATRVSWDMGLVAQYDLYAGGMVFQAYSHHSAGSKAAEGASPGGAAGVVSSRSRDGGGATITAAASSGVASGGILDVVAVGGRYDSLIARFVPPNDVQPTPYSAMGMNLAIEKIVASTLVQYAHTYEKSSGLARRLRARELLRGVSTNCDPRSSVLVYCKSGLMLKERAALANQLWEDGFTTVYMHPKSLALAQIRQYCLELGLRYVVIFIARTVKTTNLVSIKDLHADRTDAAVGSGSKSKGSASGAGGADDPNAVFQINLKDVRAFLRGRFRQQKRDAPDAGAHEGKSASGAGSGGPAHHTSGSLLNVTLVDPAGNFKSFQKNQAISMCKRALGPVLQNHHSGPYLILAVDLPLATIRNITTAYYTGGSAALESNKHKTLQETLLAHIRSYVKESAAAKTVKLVFVYSVSEHAFDVVSIPSNTKG